MMPATPPASNPWNTRWSSASAADRPAADHRVEIEVGGPPVGGGQFGAVEA